MYSIIRKNGNWGVDGLNLLFIILFSYVVPKPFQDKKILPEKSKKYPKRTLYIDELTKNSSKLPAPN